MTWGVSEPETDGDTVFLDRIVGFEPSQLEELRQETSMGNLTIEDGSVGKGASGPGATAVLEVLERLINDTAGLIAVGLALKQVIRRISDRRGQSPAIADANALGALAAAYAAVDLADARYVHTLPLNVDPGVGTDARDVWAACFDAWEEGAVHAIFMSPSGMVLGYVKVPTEAFVDHGRYRMRSEDEVHEWWTER